MTTMLRNNLYAQRVNIVSQASKMLVAVRVDPAESRIGQKGKPRERLMPRTLQERQDQVERDIKLHTEFEKAEKNRFNRESLLWTAEDRMEWQEMQSANAQYLRELFEERAALLSWLESK